MSDFGDLEDDDVVDTADADPEAVARLFYREARRLSGDDTRPLFDDLHEWERALVVFVFAALLLRLRREGSA
jgi:hypothetical protein